MPTYNLSALFQLAITSQFQQIADSIATDNWILPSGNVLPFRVSLANGAGSGQASNVWHDQRTLVTASNDDIYLNGNAAFANGFGIPLAMTNVKIILLRMTTGAASKKLVLGNHPTAPWKWDFDLATDKEDFNDWIFRGSRYDGWAVGTPIAAPLIPSVAASGSGATIPTNSYFVKVTYNNAAGESVGSTTSTSTAVTLGQNLVVTSPIASGNATTYSVYVGTAAGGPFVLQGSPTALASNTTLTSLVTAGATPPLATGAYQNSILRIANASGSTMSYDIAIWGSP